MKLTNDEISAEKIINMDRAIAAFKDYLKDFDCTDDKIKLKIGHTMRVMGSAEKIGLALKLNEEDVQLAKLIGLLHDIGRFRQLKITGSFDDSIVPHAVLSTQILFDEGEIRRFIDTDRFDELIYQAIKNHGLYQMDRTLPERQLLHAKIIRDADKLDNFYTKLVEDMETMLDVSEEELKKEDISDYAFDTFMSHEGMLNAKRQTHMDMWLSYIGYIYDLNFSETLQIVYDHRYASRLFDRVRGADKKTQEKLSLLEAEMEKYMVAHMGIMD